MLATQLQGHIVELVKVILQERVPERIAEEFVDVLVPQIQEENFEMTQIIPPERISERNVGDLTKKTPQTNYNHNKQISSRKMKNEKTSTCERERVRE